MVKKPYLILDKQRDERKPHDPKLPPIIENEKDGSILVLIPAGEFLMGRNSEHRNKIMYYLPDYYIGIYAVTNRQYGRFMRNTRHQPPDKTGLDPPIWKDGRCPKDKLDHPVVCVSWKDASAYCKWAGLMLPTEEMWEKAARGCDGRIYPWGNKLDKSRCRNDDNRGKGETCAVWRYPRGIGPNGIYQASGNVWEWCNNCFIVNSKKFFCQVLRGGSWSKRLSGDFKCTSISDGSYRDYGNNEIGFRPSRLVIP